MELNPLSQKEYFFGVSVKPKREREEKKSLSSLKKLLYLGLQLLLAVLDGILAIHIDKLKKLEVLFVEVLQLTKELLPEGSILVEEAAVAPVLVAAGTLLLC